MSDRFDADSLPDTVPDALRSKEAMIEPFDWYATWRENGPIQYDADREVYDILSYDLAKRVLQDDARFKRHSLSDEFGGLESNSPHAYLNNALMWSNDRQHSDAKNQLFEYFTPNQVRELQNVITTVTSRELDAALADGPEFDLSTEFAVPVSLKITMELLGVPRDDYEKLYEWIIEITKIKRSEHKQDAGSPPTHSREAVEYMRSLVESRTKRPQDDLISELATDTNLTQEQIGSNALDLMVASTKTMSESVTNAVYLFVKHDLLGYEDWRELATVFEEVLRYRSPIQAQLRQVSEELRLDGTHLQPGDEVVVWFGAANHDPEQFDRPREFRPDREPDHLAFGSGAHACIGAPLARFEGPIILSTFLRYVDGIEILDESVVPTTSPASLGFDRLPVSIR